MFTTPFVLLALSASAFANVFITSPVATTTFTAGQQATISWQDDGASPSLKDFGAAKVSIYAGNAQQQTSLQLIVPSVDVSTTSSIQFNVDPSIGPNSNEYFIRIESLNLKDAKSPQYPALAFSAKFTLAGMTGVFTQAVLDQIAGQSTAPLAGATSAPSSGGSTAAATTTSKASSSSKSSTSTASATNTNTSNSGAMVQAGWSGLLVGALVGCAML
jgi:hypothetical protein